MSLASAVCFGLARYRMNARRTGDVGENPSTFDDQSYVEWRSVDLRAQLCRNFRTDFAGLDVLDFGCGGGSLTFLVAEMGVKSVTGVDTTAEYVEFARARRGRLKLPVQPRFLIPSTTKTIDLPDASIDVILCFDTVEHILDYEEIMREWRRILRENGRVLIWWCPWYHPYGHHVESLIPLPWAHVVFPESVLTETCARIYDLPQFKPRVWDLDEAGQKRSNKWRTLSRLPDVNRLTIRGFERVCRRVGLRVEERRIVGCGGSVASQLTRLLTRIPCVRDFFAACVIYELRTAIEPAAMSTRGPVQRGSRGA